MKMVKINNTLWLNSDLIQAVKFREADPSECEMEPSIDIYMSGDTKQFWSFVDTPKLRKVLNDFILNIC